MGEYWCLMSDVWCLMSLDWRHVTNDTSATQHPTSTQKSLFRYVKEPLVSVTQDTGWPRRIGCLIIVGHFPQKEPWNRLYSSLLNHTLKAIGSSQHLMNTACCIWSVSSSLTILVVVFVMPDIVFVTTTIQRHRYRLTFRTPLCCPNGSLVHITIAPVSFPQVYMRLHVRSSRWKAH